MVRCLYSELAEPFAYCPLKECLRVSMQTPALNFWNLISVAYRREQIIIDRKSKHPLASQTPSKAGQLIHMPSVHLPPTFDEPKLFQKQSSYVVVTTLDPVNHRVAWVSAGGLPRWLLFADRWQALTDLGNGKTKYETFEVLTGLLAYVVKWFVGKNLRLGFRAMAEGLKSRAENAS